MNLNVHQQRDGNRQAAMPGGAGRGGAGAGGLRRDLEGGRSRTGAGSVAAAGVALLIAAPSGDLTDRPAPDPALRKNNLHWKKVVEPRKGTLHLLQ